MNEAYQNQAGSSINWPVCVRGVMLFRIVTIDKLQIVMGYRNCFIQIDILVEWTHYELIPGCSHEINTFGGLLIDSQSWKDKMGSEVVSVDLKWHLLSAKFWLVFWRKLSAA